MVFMIGKEIFREELDYQDMVLLCKDNQGDIYLGHSFLYHGRDALYLLFLYKDKLPLDKEDDLIQAWNYLDENSIRIVMVGEQNGEIAVEDFLYSHGMDKDWRSIKFYTVSNYMELDSFFDPGKMKSKDCICFILN